MTACTNASKRPGNGETPSASLSEAEKKSGGAPRSHLYFVHYPECHSGFLFYSPLISPNLLFELFFSGEDDFVTFGFDAEHLFKDRLYDGDKHGRFL